MSHWPIFLGEMTPDLPFVLRYQQDSRTLFNMDQLKMDLVNRASHNY